MYRMLIVDDEAIIVDGLILLFSETNRLSKLNPEAELELSWAYSASEALACLRSNRIDIVLTDIEMPEMNGLALQREINRQWPRCKVIFLTGYNDFDYIQSSSRNGAADYVLKTEGDEQIMEAVRKAIGQLEDELAVAQMMKKAESQISLALPLMQREFLLELMNGRSSLGGAEAGDAQLQELNIPFSANQPILMIMGRIDSWRADMRHSDKMLFMFAVHNIAEEYLADTFRIVQVKYGQDQFVWLLQDRSGEPGREEGETCAEAGETEQEAKSKSMRRLNGYLELIQAACKSYLKIPCSFVHVSEPFPWEDISRKFDTLSFLFARGLGTGQEALLSDHQLIEAARERHGGRSLMRTVQLLEEYLDKGKRAEFIELFQQLMETVEDGSAAKMGIAAEIFYSAVSMFIAYINRWGLMKTVTELFNVGKLFSIEEHAAWQDTTAEFLRLAHVLFDERTQENDQQTSDVIGKVQNYIKDNLGGELSLTKLSELVYLSPSYLSKLYKQETGESLTDSIIGSRVHKAKELLLHSEMKIHKVGKAVGFESAAYFARCFKKMTSRTPQEFRDGTKKPQMPRTEDSTDLI